MPSHTWNEVGRWGDSVRANLQAWHSDLKAATGQGVAIYPSHNLHMLLFAASYDGQGSIAMRAARDHTKMTGAHTLELLVLVRFGRFDDILDLTATGAGDYPKGVWEFAQGYARLRKDEPEFAQAHLIRLARIAAGAGGRVRFDSASTLLGVLEEILRGEILLAESDMSGAIAAFERAVEHEDDLGYDEPEPLPFSARHWLGAALNAAQRFHAAERVYREELTEHPHNGWSLYGLLQSIEGQGNTDEAVEADFAESWARSDVWVSTSRY
jgi:tetratricopeptide (TPR) repeat protein